MVKCATIDQDGTEVEILKHSEVQQALIALSPLSWFVFSFLML